MVPPEPQADFSWVKSLAMIAGWGSSPVKTVTHFPFLRRSVFTIAVCFSGGITASAILSGGQTHSESNRSHRSHLGGRSHAVPSKSRIFFRNPSKVHFIQTILWVNSEVF